MTRNLNTRLNRTLTAHVFVRETLREAILDGTLPPGSRLIQADIATQLSVSNTPVREALRDLAGEGLVDFDAHRGSRVRSLDIDEVRELYEMRIALEPLMVRRVMRQITPDRLDRAEELCQQLSTTTNLTEWSELNRQFHSLFTLDEKDSRLASVMAGLRDSASIYVALSLGANSQRIDESNAEHAELIKCYRAGDAKGAIALTIRHLRATLADIESAKDKFTA